MEFHMAAAAAAVISISQNYAISRFRYWKETNWRLSSSYLQFNEAKIKM